MRTSFPEAKRVFDSALVLVAKATATLAVTNK